MRSTAELYDWELRHLHHRVDQDLPFYRSLALALGGPVLELGCGTGRITRGLLALGHPVTGIDFSEDMLARMPAEARTLHHDIETLRLPERFDAVLLTSNMTSGETSRALAFLYTARAHLAPRGVVVIERFNPRWADLDAMLSIAAPRTRDHITGSLHDISVDGNAVTMTIRYQHDDGRVWTQSSTMYTRSDAELTELLRQADLQPVRWLDEECDWLLAEALG